MYTVIDFETTGLNHRTDQIIEIAAIKLNKELVECGRLHLYINTNIQLSDFIQEYTGITNEFLEKNGISYNSGMTILENFIDSDTVVAQYAPFDLSFIENRHVFQCNFICTRSLNLMAFPNESSSLEPTCKRLGIKLDVAHRAMNDVEATVELFKYHCNNAFPNTVENTLVINERTLNYIPLKTKSIKHVSGIDLYAIL